MRTPRRSLAALAAVALALPLAGCPTLDGGTASTELTTTQFDDIPAPLGFSLDLGEGRTFSYTEGAGGPVPVRLGRMEYTGLGDAEEVVAWYASEMPRPIHGWDAGTPVPGEVPAMLFKRGGERCLVTAKPEGSALRVVVERNTGGALPR